MSIIELAFWIALFLFGLPIALYSVMMLIAVICMALAGIWKAVTEKP